MVPTTLRMTFALALCLTISILVGCGERGAAPVPEGDAPSAVSGSGPDSGATPGTVESRLQAEWQEKVAGLDLTRASGINESNKTMRKLVDGLEPEEFEELSTRLKAAAFSTMTPFQKNLLGVAVRRVMLSGDRAALVRFLAERCPREIPPAPIEYTLCAEERRGKVPDGFTVLAESYRAAENDDARSVLLDAIASALPSLRDRTPDDAAFVAAAEAWHAEHKGRFKLRARYVFAWQDHRFAEGAEELFELE